MRAPFRNRFDPDREFTVRKRLTLGGVTFYPGDPFDKTLVNTRRLRQLFDHRTIVYEGETPGAIIPQLSDEPEAAPEPTQAELEEAEARAAEEAAAKLQAERRATEIPEDWATMAWPKRLALASSLSDEKIHNGAEAAAAIEAELAIRASQPS
jgi:hypothetical protein